ncbi:transcriptional regulator (plasmid) [Rippkaea orientalis PCC 8801]|uniref:Transcriptional regulator n=1 Tax=Rippkaea orientalis (strain PCC 8801 / RF-1) TaxID=41431 RepID=B7K6M8_RIPO1|nr:helix-turn-helix transcriptional regulator [Rippkaea orientalis]ACK68450.1 transcriptional regulator [Rippkaea orientalis PCC 8801]
MPEFTISSGNFFADLGFSNASEKLAKVKLASLIYDLIDERQLADSEVARILTIDLSQVTNLKKGRLSDFSLEKLLSFLVALGQNIEIMVSPKPETMSSGTIQVIRQSCA